MRHAAGEHADRFHLLRLPKLGLEQLPIGDVEADAERTKRTARRIVRDSRAVLHPMQAAIGPDRSEFRDEVVAAVGKRRRDLLAEGGAILGMHQGEERVGGAAKRGESDAEERRFALRPDHTSCIEVRFSDPDARRSQGELGTNFETPALGDLLLERRHMPLKVVVESRALVGDAGLSRKRGNHFFVGLGELVGA